MWFLVLEEEMIDKNLFNCLIMKKLIILVVQVVLIFVVVLRDRDLESEVKIKF